MLRKYIVAFLLVTCALGTGCGAGAELRFADDDAGASDGSSATSGDASVTDAPVSDAGQPAPPAPDAQASDTGAAAICPVTPPPPGVNACCGATACIDRANNNNCALCVECAAQRCQPSEVCCYGQNDKIACKKSAADCK